MRNPPLPPPPTTIYPTAADVTAPRSAAVAAATRTHRPPLVRRIAARDDDLISSSSASRSRWWRSHARWHVTRTPPPARRFPGETVLPADVFDRFRPVRPVTRRRPVPPPSRRSRPFATWRVPTTLLARVCVWAPLYFWLILMVFGFEFYLVDKSSDHRRPPRSLRPVHRPRSRQPPTTYEALSRTAHDASVNTGLGVFRSSRIRWIMLAEVYHRCVSDWVVRWRGRKKLKKYTITCWTCTANA